MKTILVPTDFSECANNATHYASELAVRMKAKLILFHAYHVPELVSETPVTITSSNLQMEDKYRERMELVIRDLKKKHDPGLWIDYVIKPGFAADEIPVVAKDKNAHLIVMGTHGSSGFHEIFIGSNTEKVIRNAAIPVISIKESASALKIATIIFATDFSEETKLVFPAVERFAKLLHAKIKIVKVVTRSEFQTTYETEHEIGSLTSQFKKRDVSISIYYANNKQDGIRRFATIHHGDMIAMGTHGRHGLYHLFKGSAAEDLANHSSIPVLIINFHNEPAVHQPLERRSDYPEYIFERNGWM